MNKFDKTFEQIMQDQFLFIEDINKLYLSANNILYETNTILPCPKQIFDIVKSKVLKLIKHNDYQPIKINLKHVLSDAFIKNQDDKNLISTLYKLFENHDSAYFNVKITGSKDVYYDKKGEYELPPGFIENLIDYSTLHYSYPKIKTLDVNDEMLNKFVKNYKNDITLLKSMYDKQQKAIECFKRNILNFNDFGTIVIYPWNCTQDDANVDLPTLDEVIEHECQHLCIFLLSLAKTCIYFGLHFSNDIKSRLFTYQLKESEFITLTGSYNNILLRIYKQIQEPKSVNAFIKTVLDLSIFGKTTNDEKYINALNSSQQFSRIKEFFKTIYTDSKFGLYERKFDDNKLNKTLKTSIIPNKKFKTLLKWTIKNFERNLY